MLHHLVSFSLGLILWQCVWHFFLDLPLDEDEGEGSRIALLLGPHTLVAAVRKSGRVLVVWTLSSLWRDLYKNVLQLHYNFKSSLLTNWSAKWGLKVDSGLVAILHLQRFAKDCQLTPDNYLCAFTVAHPVQIYLGPQIDARGALTPQLVEQATMTTSSILMLYSCKNLWKNVTC